MKSMILAALAVLLVVATVASRTWYITPDGSGDAPTIQAGINAASYCDTILLADGIFTGHENRDIWADRGLVIRSESQNPELCIIDGEEAYRAFTCSAVGPCIPLKIEGIRIQNCLRTGEGPINSGGALLADYDVLLTNCVFAGNSVSSYGGAVSVRYGQLTIEDCTFIGCSATIGGGAISAISWSESAISVAISGCDFLQNRADSGGAIYWLGAADGIVTDCTFSANRAKIGGAVNAKGGGIVGCRLSGNSATRFGGAIHSGDSLSIAGCSLSGNTSGSRGGGISCFGFTAVNACTLVSNTANASGGAIHCAGCAVTLVDCRMSGNSAPSGGAIHCDSQSFPEISFSELTASTADYGGAMMLSGGYVHDNVFDHNVAYWHGGGVYITGGGTARLERNVMYDNEAGYHGGALFLYESERDTILSNTMHGNLAVLGAGIDIYGLSFPIIENNIVVQSPLGNGIWCDSGSYPALSCNDVWDNWSGDYGGSCPDVTGMNGNISVSPLFCAPDSLDFRLDADSPCLNDPTCGVIGALGMGCPLSGVEGPTYPGDSSELKVSSLVVQPNPFSGYCSVDFAVNNTGRVRLSLYTVQGQKIANLLDSELEAGKHSYRINLDRSQLNSPGSHIMVPGVYFVVVAAGNETVVTKAILTR
ncbi:right-handed parallel beta-helix repeat-containing protein [Candidatus Eisenbacteria bacterium]|uniref:Right-handed parallel beta-helix repeat-containing protein n=1 Tax=Eiseniibacteriota bacterium TaxID=2212470 RepID=A0ABV6YQ63_UNCEI